jgi:oxaloacetate decarboxylase alpha subunit
MSQIQIIDTTLRDGQQSLWASRMRAGAMLPAIGDIDRAGYDGVEFAVPTAHFPRAVRDLGENPWDWFKLGAAKVHRTPLRLHGGIHTRLATVPMSVRTLFFDILCDLGIQVTRTSDPWNDFGRLGDTVRVMREHGIETVANIIYAVSPRHTAEYFARKTREAVAIAPYRICFKDVGGLMTPEAARELIPVVVANAGDVPVEFHAHCNNGLAPYNVLIAAELGIGIIHTALPPLANGSSQPSVFNVVANLRARGFDVPLDLAPLERVSRHFDRVAEVENLPVGAPALYDQALYEHQVPGGMISNMRFQLEQLNKSDLLDEALLEVAEVRKDFGYPIMVTPLAQFVGTQAVVNVLSGQRYGTVTDETIAYALGQWGAEAIDVMDPVVRATVLDRQRAEALRDGATKAEAEGEISLAAVRQRYGLGISDEDLITRAFMGASSSSNVIPAPGNPPSTYAEYDEAHGGVNGLLKQLASTGDIRNFEWRSDKHSLRITRSHQPGSRR